MVIFQRNECIGVIRCRNKGTREILVGLVIEAEGGKVVMRGHLFAEGKSPEKLEKPHVVKREENPRKLPKYSYEINYLKGCLGDPDRAVVACLKQLLNDEAWFETPVPDEEPVLASMSQRCPTAKSPRVGRQVRSRVRSR